MQPSVTSILAFSAQIKAGLEQLTQAEWVYGTDPTPAQELLLFRTQCQLYDDLVTCLPAAHAEPEAVRTFVQQVLPSMEGTARTLESFTLELSECDPYGPELAPALELLVRLGAVISALQQRYLPTDARA